MANVKKGEFECATINNNNINACGVRQGDGQIQASTEPWRTIRGEGGGGVDLNNIAFHDPLDVAQIV